MECMNPDEIQSRVDAVVQGTCRLCVVHFGRRTYDSKAQAEVILSLLLLTLT